MSEFEIKKLEEVLSKFIGNDKIVSDVKKSPLIAKGENYGSIVLRVDVTLKNQKNNTNENLHAVAKLIPKAEYLQELFDVQNTVKKEIAFYSIIVPTLQIFQRECGVNEVMDFFPKFYGCRLNLREDDRVDDNSVVLLENLVESGFINVDRFIGFDLQTAKLILKDLAVFHAVPLAMKLKTPEQFQKYIRANCGNFRPPPPPPKVEGSDKPPGYIYYEVFYECDKCLPYMKSIKNMVNIAENPPSEFVAREPFATLCHGDMWVNNQMIKFEKGRPIQNKFVDFQVYAYNSPMTDLFFFLWSSVRQSVLEESLDDLIKFYYNNFIQHLTKLGCDTQLFDWNMFSKELKLSASFDFPHVLFMIFFIIFGEKGVDRSLPNFAISSKDIDLKVKEKLWFMVQECGKRGWI